MIKAKVLRGEQRDLAIHHTSGAETRFSNTTMDKTLGMS